MISAEYEIDRPPESCAAREICEISADSTDERSRSGIIFFYTTTSSAVCTTYLVSRLLEAHEHLALRDDGALARVDALDGGVGGSVIIRVSCSQSFSSFVFAIPLRFSFPHSPSSFVSTIPLRVSCLLSSSSCWSGVHSPLRVFCPPFSFEFRFHRLFRALCPPFPFESRVRHSPSSLVSTVACQL